MQKRAPQHRPADLALSLRGVTKRYPLYARPLDILLEALTGRARHQERTVLKNVSLDVGLGEVVGIIGANGAGKSTLLKLITGTLEPTAGSIAVNGRIAAILELGMGFNPGYTGRDNVIMSSVMRGMSEAKARQKLELGGRLQRACRCYRPAVPYVFEWDAGTVGLRRGHLGGSRHHHHR